MADSDSSSSLSLSSSESEEETTPSRPAKKKLPEKKGKKKGELSFDDIAQHGYKSGLSVLKVPAPTDWSWSSGRRKPGDEDDDHTETIEERKRTHQIANAGAEKAADILVQEYETKKKQRKDAADQRALTFSKKEKRKRDLGQASRGKSYVEEEKRLLRDQGIYSGFD